MLLNSQSPPLSQLWNLSLLALVTVQSGTSPNFALPTSVGLPLADLTASSIVTEFDPLFRR